MEINEDMLSEIGFNDDVSFLKGVWLHIDDIISLRFNNNVLTLWHCDRCSSEKVLNLDMAELEELIRLLKK